MCKERAMMEQAMLDRAIEAFERDGGKVEVLPSFVFKPLPPRSISKTSSLPKRRRVNCRIPDSTHNERLAVEEQIIQSGHGERIKAMALIGLSVIQIANRMDIPRSVVRSVGKRMGFKVLELATTSRIGRKTADTF